MCCYIGRGNAVLEWTAPDNDVLYYEIYYSKNNIVFDLCMTNIKSNRLHLSGLKINTILFMKIRSVYYINEEVYSSFAYIKKGKIEASPILMRITGVNGSKITSGAIFNFIDYKIGRLIPVQADSEINISN